MSLPGIFATIVTYIRGELGFCKTAWAIFPGVQQRGWISAVPVHCGLVTCGPSPGGLQYVFSVLHHGDEKLVWSSLLEKRMPKMLQPAQVPVSLGGIRVSPQQQAGH